MKNYDNEVQQRKSISPRGQRLHGGKQITLNKIHIQVRVPQFFSFSFLRQRDYSIRIFYTTTEFRAAIWADAKSSPKKKI